MNSLFLNPSGRGGELAQQLDEILQDFKSSNDSSRIQQGTYPLKTLLILFKHAGGFHPLLLKKLCKKFQLDRTNQEVYVTRKQLLDELSNPETRNFTLVDLEDIYDILRGENTEVKLSELNKNNENLKRKALSREEVFQILSPILNS